MSLDKIINFTVTCFFTCLYGSYKNSRQTCIEPPLVDKKLTELVFYIYYYYVHADRYIDR